MKIIVADDSKTNLVLITGFLEKLGHSVVALTSGEDAIEAFNKDHPDLVILDVAMQGIGGFECARRLRAFNTEVWIPIIFLSANVDDESVATGIDAGGDDYLTKPFSEITLSAKIKAMQRISDMQQKLYETMEKLARLSATDALTGIYNRFYFDRALREKLGIADRYHRSLALLFLDIDNFKLVNDSFGHSVGDLLLKEFARRLQSCLRLDDFIARIGGDEFAVILMEIESLEYAGIVAQKMLDAMVPDFYLDGNNIRIGASIGIACYPYHSTTHGSLLKNADVAMYHAKELGRNNYQYFSEKLNEQYKQHINLEYSLKFALERNELSLTYQPIFNLKTHEVIGLETLLDWNHPKLGRISPDIFIPIAEETGLIAFIGNWVLRNACKQAKLWSLKNRKNFKLAVNLSSQQLLQDKFYQLVLNILDFYELPPHLLELELTETIVMSYKADLIKDVLIKLSELGISIAIDDFGTGYSSLTRLKTLAINTLKIDKTFVQDAITDPNTAIIVNCLITLGKNLNLNVVAEGIETEEQHKFLIENGCLYGQGYLLSRALSVEMAGKLLKEINKISK